MIMIIDNDNDTIDNDNDNWQWELTCTKNNIIRKEKGMWVPTSDDFYGSNVTNSTSSTCDAKLQGCKHCWVVQWRMRWYIDNAICKMEPAPVFSSSFRIWIIGGIVPGDREYFIWGLKLNRLHQLIGCHAPQSWRHGMLMMMDGYGKLADEEEGWLWEAGRWGESDCCCRMSFISKSIKPAVRSSLAATSSDI